MRLAKPNFSKRRGYLFSAVIVIYGILSSTAAFSQIDYFYGINKKGFRVGIGTGGTRLNSNWGSYGVGVAGTLDVDYDFTQFFSIGLNTEVGTLSGKDSNNKLTPASTSVRFTGGTVNMKLGVGQVVDFFPKNGVQDVLKRFYFGAGVGLVNSSVTLQPHYGYMISNPSNQYILQSTRNSIETNVSKGVGTGNFTVIPLNLGTYISLRRYFKRDALEINPNFQYNFVLSPVFDGYQPASKPIGTAIDVNGDQAYSVVSVSIRYKFH